MKISVKFLATVGSLLFATYMTIMNKDSLYIRVQVYQLDHKGRDDGSGGVPGVKSGSTPLRPTVENKNDVFKPTPLRSIIDNGQNLKLETTTLPKQLSTTRTTIPWRLTATTQGIRNKINVPNKKGITTLPPWLTTTVGPNLAVTTTRDSHLNIPHGMAETAKVNVESGMSRSQSVPQSQTSGTQSTNQGQTLGSQNAQQGHSLGSQNVKQGQTLGSQSAQQHQGDSRGQILPLHGNDTQVNSQ